MNWPNLIVWLPLPLEMLGNEFIAIACFPGCDFINLEINLIFLIKQFFYMTKLSRQKLKYLEDKQKSKIKSIFPQFWRAFICQKLAQTWECVFSVSFRSFKFLN